MVRVRGTCKGIPALTTEYRPDGRFPQARADPPLFVVLSWHSGKGGEDKENIKAFTQKSALVNRPLPCKGEAIFILVIASNIFNDEPNQ